MAAAATSGTSGGGVQENPLGGESDDTEKDRAGEATRRWCCCCRLDVDFARPPLTAGGGVAVAGLAGVLLLISAGEVSTDVEKAGFSRPVRY